MSASNTDELYKEIQHIIEQARSLTMDVPSLSAKEEIARDIWYHLARAKSLLEEFRARG